MKTIFRALITISFIAATMNPARSADSDRISKLKAEFVKIMESLESEEATGGKTSWESIVASLDENRNSKLDIDEDEPRKRIGPLFIASLLKLKGSDSIPLPGRLTRNRKEALEQLVKMYTEITNDDEIQTTAHLIDQLKTKTESTIKQFGPKPELLALLNDQQKNRAMAGQNGILNAFAIVHFLIAKNVTIEDDAERVAAVKKEITEIVVAGIKRDLGYVPPRPKLASQRSSRSARTYGGTVRYIDLVKGLQDYSLKLRTARKRYKMAIKAIRDIDD